MQIVELWWLLARGPVAASKDLLGIGSLGHNYCVSAARFCPPSRFDVDSGDKDNSFPLSFAKLALLPLRRSRA